MALVSRHIGESLTRCLAFTSLFQMNTHPGGGVGTRVGVATFNH